MSKYTITHAAPFHWTVKRDGHTIITCRTKTGAANRVINYRRRDIALDDIAQAREHANDRPTPLHNIW